MDFTYHGEEAYATGEGAILVTPEAGIEGEVSRLNKELVAYATSVVNDGKLSILYRAEVLRSLGLTNEQLFEVTTVVSIFVKNAAFTTALQLDPTST